MAKLLSTTPQVVFLLTVFIQAVIVLTMAGLAFKLVRENQDFQDALQQSKYTTLSCYLAFFIVAQVFEFVFAFDALRLRDILQIVDILLLHLALTVLAAVHVSQIKSILLLSDLSPWQCSKLFGIDECDGYDSLWRQVRPYLLAVPSVLFAAWFPMLLCAIRLRSEFHLDSSKADSKLSTKDKTYQVAVCMLKISFFCFIGVLSQLLIAEVPSDTIDFGLAIAAAPVVYIILLPLMSTKIRNGSWLIAMNQLLMLGGMVYPYMVARIFNPEAEAWYLAISQSNITFFMAILLCALLATFSVIVVSEVIKLMGTRHYLRPDRTSEVHT